METQIKLSLAPEGRRLEVIEINLPEDVKTMLSHLGLEVGEVIERTATMPLGDPIALHMGGQVFSLRKEVCEKMKVKVL
ncbi:MAG: ferrous iron transport protein A [Oligoflexia bacterium]|nr:ferrous iron transport protein A [Oligoflexia bacterium]